jgi:glucose-6-phosphate 1-dehydrogenase
MPTYHPAFILRQYTPENRRLVWEDLKAALARARESLVEASWTAVSSILEVWNNNGHEFPNYVSGTWGPAASDGMLAGNGHIWRSP